MGEIKIIQSTGKSKRHLNLRKVWNYRALIFAFALRDIRVQYAQTKLGLIWSFIQAITAAIIVHFFFGLLLNIKISSTPYITYAFPGMMAWYYFSYMVTNSGTSLVQSQHIIKKIYFPKLILPLYKTIVGLIEFLIWFILLVIILIYYRQPVHWNILLLPIGIILNIICGLSIGILLSALTVRYRDAFHIIPYLIGFGVFVTPVFFETAMIPQNYHFLIYFNPMAGVITFYRYCILTTDLSLNYLFGFIPVIFLFVTGLYYFHRVEGIIADII